MRSIIIRANNPPNTVLVKYMTAGPAAMRTALRSLVRRAMMSPVRQRAYHAASSVVRRVKMSRRKSVSMCRLTPLSVLRMVKRSTPATAEVSTIATPSCHTSRAGAPSRIRSRPRCRYVGIDVASAADITTEASPSATLRRYGW